MVQAVSFMVVAAVVSSSEQLRMDESSILEFC
jgi:hypothetical protein